MPNKEQYEKINKEEAQQYHKLWRMKNELKIRNYYKQYRSDNLDKIKKIQRAWYLKQKKIKHNPEIQYKKIVITFD